MLIIITCAMIASISVVIALAMLLSKWYLDIEEDEDNRRIQAMDAIDRMD